MTDKNPITSHPMSGSQLAAAWTISGIAFALIGLHIILSAWVALDQGTLVLLAIGALPWLTLFVKSIEVPGLGKWETQEKVEGKADHPLPPAGAPHAVAADVLSARGKKILATLWHYQVERCGTDTPARWTFEVKPLARDYPQYLAGLSEVVNLGLVAVSPENYQCMLTDEGMEYCKSHQEIREYDDIYRFDDR